MRFKQLKQIIRDDELVRIVLDEGGVLFQTDIGKFVQLTSISHLDNYEIVHFQPLANYGAHEVMLEITIERPSEKITYQGEIW